MDGELYQCSWPVPASGYRWEQILPASVHMDKEYANEWFNDDDDSILLQIIRGEMFCYLVENPSEGSLFDVPAYNPFAVRPHLFRTFADTDPTPRAILDFASRYGWLGAGTSIKARDHKPRTRRRTALVGESYGTWVRQIALMRDMVRLWDLCGAGNIEALSRHIRWDSEKVKVKVIYQSQPSRSAEDLATPVYARPHELLSYRRHHETIAEIGPKILIGPIQDQESFEFERLTPGDVLLPALLYLQRQINKHLEASAEPRMLWDLAGIRLNLRFLPSYLLSMLWMQFACEVSGKVAFRECGSCQRWVRIGPDAARTSRLYCSNACRMRGLRDRQRAARALRSEGKSIEAIADELNSDAETIKKWVSTMAGGDH